MTYSPMQLAEAFIQAGELTDALDALDLHLGAAPEDHDARRLRANVRRRLGSPADLTAALADLDALPQRTTDDALNRAAILGDLGQDDAARDVLLAALDDAPTHERLAEAVVTRLRAMGDVARAQAIVAAQPDGWRWSAWAGDLAAQSGDPAAAIHHYDAAIAALEIRYPDLLAAEPAHTLDAPDRTQAAAMTVSGAYARLRLARGDAYAQQDMPDAAQADYIAAARRLPDDPAVPFNQGLLLARHGELDAALALCRPALEAAPVPLAAAFKSALQADPRLHALRLALESPLNGPG